MCDHKPQEIFKATFFGDEIFTCRKCKETIVAKHPEERRMIALIIFILTLVFSTIVKVFSTLFLSYSASSLVYIVFALIFCIICWCIYAMLIAEYELL